MSAIADNLARVREKIAAAAERAGRPGSDITLVTVAKKQTAVAVVAALAAGATDIGENYVQEAAQKRTDVSGGHWHLLGHLQSNKSKLAVSLFDLIQSVDSVKLARTLGRQAAAGGRTQNILLQVHLGEEETKTGLRPEEALEAAAEMAAIPEVVLLGLMGIAPFGVDSRPCFQNLRHLFDALPPVNRQILSMGMSGDFETAIEEGATMIRVGTAIFGPRA